jgi:hypothetical protein
VSAVFGFEVDVAAALDAVSGAPGSAVFTGAATSGVGAGVTLTALAAGLGASIGFSGLAGAAPCASGCSEEPPPTRITVIVPTITVNATAAVMRIGTFWFFGLSREGYPADVCEKPAAVDAPGG